MRVCLVCRVHPSQRPGGMPFVAADRAAALARAGHDVWFLAAGPVAERVCDGYGLRFCGGPAAAYSAEFAAGCLGAVRDLRPDVLHLDSFSAAHPWHLEAGLPAAVTLHGFGWGSAMSAFHRALAAGRPPAPVDVAALAAEAAALRRFARVLVVSDHERYLCESGFGVPATVVHNPIPAWFFDDPAGPQPADPAWMCAAVSGHRERGFACAAEAAQRAGAAVRVVSDVPRRSMPALYDAARGLLLPTTYAQGFDLAVAESLARRRPVIAYGVGSYWLEARLGLPGLRVVPLHDVNALARAIAEPVAPVPAGAADRHRGVVHVARWLSAVG